MSSTWHSISTAFLAVCPATEAYKWLEASFIKPKAGNYFFSGRSDLEEKRRTVEYILYKRNDYLIDLGLAQFAYTPYVLKRIFNRRGVAIRCAVLSNPCLFSTSIPPEPIVDLKVDLGSVNERELKTVTGNPYLPVEFYEHLLERTEYFKEISDKHYKMALIELGKNPRMAQEYSSDFMDGWTEYRYNSVFSKAWELTKELPATQEWAYVLNSLLQKAIHPVGFKEIPETLKRWEIDRPTEAKDSYAWPGDSYYLRSRIADLLPPDEALLKAEDSALRRSFYRRFSPWKFKNWSDFAAADVKVFLEEAIRSNMQLWYRAEEREVLSRLAWDHPDPRSDMMMPNLYKGIESDLNQDHPEWFAPNPADTVNAELVARMEEVLSAINEKIEAFEPGNPQKTQRWWKK